MSNRFKVLVAALGLVVAAGTIGEASATTTSATTTIAKPVATQGVASKTVTKKTVVGKAPIGMHHRIRVAHKGVVKHVKIAHRITTRAKIAHKLGLKHVAKLMTSKTSKTIVR